MSPKNQIDRLSQMLLATILAAFANSGVLGVATGPDFNGDGFADLAVGVPFESIGSITTAGAVNVIYGTAFGLASDGNQFWHQNASGIADSAEVGDQFGHDPTWGDFNADGFDDLAIGAPFENMGPIADAGAVHVIYGSPAGLSATGSQFWHQDSAGIADACQSGDLFGLSLAAADFNGDGFDDLAIGAPEEDVAGRNSTGGVNVLYGSAAGLTSAGDQFWHQNRPNIIDACENGDAFGFSLAARDFNGDGFDDLAIGVPNENLGGVPDTGAVNVLYGSAQRLTASGNQLWHQNLTGVETNEDIDVFGFSLAAGDFNGDGLDDLAAGLPFDSFATGSVIVLYGTVNGLTATGSQLWHQGNAEVPESPEVADLFGWTVSAADFNGDGMDELAIGVPLESVGAAMFAGMVIVLEGSAAGLTSAGSQAWTQGMLQGQAQEQEWFGHSLMIGDFDGNGICDLAVAAPFEDVDSIVDAGAVYVMYATLSGLINESSQSWSQNSPGIHNACEADEGFGFGNGF